uniref:Uncharacterized protein n=1 Tax=Lotus japonicus TaxID=34305 RepID=I3S823_LOTJA|nr:unknown [Lotus japonicus]
MCQSKLQALYRPKAKGKRKKQRAPGEKTGRKKTTTLCTVIVGACPRKKKKATRRHKTTS